MRKLNGAEIEDYACEIFKVLKEVPQYYVIEILELSKDFRDREGEIQDLDYSSSDEEQEEERHWSSESQDSDDEN